MRTLLVALLLANLTACATSEAPAYYALLLPQTEAPARQVTQGPRLIVDRVTLPEYLNDLGIAFQLDDVQIVTANQARWAESLDKQLTRSLIQGLSQHLQQVQVLEGPDMVSEAWHLSLEVSGFQGRYDGQAIVAGRWLLKRGDQTFSEAFQHKVALSDEGYPALVRALRQGWQQEVVSLAGQLQTAIVQPVVE
ncbi:membrane integrity-associated transporter subunit PqiC [Pseudaeromonas sharmana]|uniref:Membrane integrity-associated transporter subunit PqiC n=1 Tax=Pseudaeromonas sharmana TaxID=328412 RepID=A0ABV8CLM0_9GAMM